MKKIYLLIVLFGSLILCACEKESINPLMGDQAQNQLQDGALKGAPEHGKKHAVPFKAKFDQEQTILQGDIPLIYIEMEGAGTATHLGKTNLWVGQDWDFGDFSGPAEGAAEVIFTAANGDILYADLYAYNATELDENMNPVFATIWGAGNFTGGTGRFSNANGSFTLAADYNFATEESTAIYTGEIMY